MQPDLKQILLDLGIDQREAIVIIDDPLYLSELYHSESRLSPEDFLEQAEDNFEQGGQSALLDSISNAQRAIRCQIDEWIDFFGFEENLLTKKKLDILKEIGIAPRILKKSLT